MKLKKLAAGILASACLVSVAQSATLPIESMWINGVNKVSDDFSETLLTFNGSTYVPKVTGDIAVGDVLLSWLKFTSYQSSSIPASNYNEFTMLSAVEVSSVTAITGAANIAASCGAGLTLSSGCSALEFTASAAFGGILAAYGVNLNGLALTANSVSVLLEDTVSNASPIGNLVNHADGKTRMVVDLDASKGDYWISTGPKNINDFANPLNAPGGLGKKMGSLAVDLTLSSENFASVIFDENITGDGTLRPELIAPGVMGVGGDASFYINATKIPEPGSLALLGLGLAGLGAARRRK